MSLDSTSQAPSPGSERTTEVRVHPTAHAVSGDSAAIAYSVHRIVPGPNGESQQAFVLFSSDRGATWTPVPLVRTVWSSVRFCGFPVWPPESIDTIETKDGLLRIGFRDEWVAFEPGGESLWDGIRWPNGLWTVTRLRLMDYDGADIPGQAAATEVILPEGFARPSGIELETIASRLAREVPSPAMMERYPWLTAILAGSPFAIWGAAWQSWTAASAVIAGLLIASILIQRRHRRRMTRL
jgi:hypothetical protein